jgi:hypothetical protein
MTREFEKTIRGADPSLDLRVCVEHGPTFIHQGCFDRRLRDGDARRMLAGKGGPA